MNYRKFGNAGETLAASYLEEKGYRILKRNFWCKAGEVDIIAQKDDCVHFVEVKTRTGNYYGTPSESVTRHKLNRIRLVAEVYMKWAAEMPGLGKKMQVDLIEVELRHSENI